MVISVPSAFRFELTIESSSKRPMYRSTFPLLHATDIQLADAQFYHPNSLNTPYVELGCGIGNILRILDIHSVWRLTNWQDTSTPRWGIRFRLHISL